MMAPHARLWAFAGLLSLLLLPFAVPACSTTGRPGELGNLPTFDAGVLPKDATTDETAASDATTDGSADGSMSDAGAGDGAVEASGQADTISWISTRCGATSCSIMGLKTSGFNEQALVGFKVVDANGNPVSGVLVSFRIDNAPTGTTISASGLTDPTGIATATVQSGTSVGAFIVKASIIIKGNVVLEVDSPTIGVRGAKPTNKGFSLVCSPVNIAAYWSPAPPRLMSVDCKVRVVDRFNNPVGTGTTVNFKSEAGTIPASLASKLYDPQTSNTDEGTATVTFSTQGTFPPQATDPLAADATQYPNARPAEPSRQDGLVVRNPRDGLVTLIAYTRGEEYFDDKNNNGTWDTGEQFVDEGEPFVDSNDNGIWDAGEFYVDESADGQWNGPNGKWDVNKNIWTEARIVYTDFPSASASASSWEVNPLTVAKGAYVTNRFTILDLNLNRVSSEFAFVAGPSPPRGSVTQFLPSVLIDQYGMDIDRSLVDATSLGECKAATSICKFRTVFKAWSTGNTGFTTFKGADLADVNPPYTGVFTADVTSGAARFGLPLNITMQ